MKRRILAAIVAVFLGIPLAGCDGDGPEPNVIDVHVCDPWCIHAPRPHPPGKWW